MAFQNNKHSSNAGQLHASENRRSSDTAYELRCSFRNAGASFRYSEDLCSRDGRVFGLAAAGETEIEDSKKADAEKFDADSEKDESASVCTGLVSSRSSTQSPPLTAYYDESLEDLRRMDRKISNGANDTSVTSRDSNGIRANSVKFRGRFGAKNVAPDENGELFTPTFYDTTEHMEKTFSCHLQEVEMILERISSSATSQLGSKNANAEMTTKAAMAMSKEGPTGAINGKRNSVSARWRDYFSNVSGSGRLNRKRGESFAVAKVGPTMADERANEKFVVTRSQSMRYPDGKPTRSCPKLVTTMFDRVHDEGCYSGRHDGLPGGASPARSCKSSPRKMESSSTEFRRRTASIPNRRDRRSQSMRVPSTALKPQTAARPQNLMAGQEQGDFERMRTFSIDPSKPGVVINRGDSFRRRSNTGASMKARSQPEKPAEPAPGATATQGLETEATNAQPRHSLSPMSPTNPETFVTPPESLSPCTNGQVLGGVRKYDIIVIGLEGVGKTAMINQFMTSEDCNPFQSDAEESTPLDNSVGVQLDGEESRLTFHEVDNHKNEIWHTLNGDGYLIVYSIDDALSFRNAKKLVQELRRRAATAEKPIILVANKIDLERKRQVTADDARSIAKEYDCKFVEIAVALGHHVDELLVGILAQVRQSELELAANGELGDETEVFSGDGNEGHRPISNSLTSKRSPRSSSSTEAGTRFSPSRQQQNQNQQQLRRSSTKRRKRLSTSKASDENGSVSPPTSCSNLTAVGHRFVQKVFGRRRSSRSLEDLLSLA